MLSEENLKWLWENDFSTICKSHADDDGFEDMLEFIIYSFVKQRVVLLSRAIRAWKTGPFIPDPRQRVLYVLIEALEGTRGKMKILYAWNSACIISKPFTRKHIKDEVHAHDEAYLEAARAESTEQFPPCILAILNGMSDGKKRALFILGNYFRSLNFSRIDIEEEFHEWNKKNKPKLPERYINRHISYIFNRKVYPPPNCGNDIYRGVCRPDVVCKKIRNPVRY